MIHTYQYLSFSLLSLTCLNHRSHLPMYFDIEIHWPWLWPFWWSYSLSKFQWNTKLHWSKRYVKHHILFIWPWPWCLNFSCIGWKVMAWTDRHTSRQDICFKKRCNNQCALLFWTNFFHKRKSVLFLSNKNAYQHWVAPLEFAFYHVSI